MLIFAEFKGKRKVKEYRNKVMGLAYTVTANAVKIGSKMVKIRNFNVKTGSEKRNAKNEIIKRFNNVLKPDKYS